MRLIQFVLVFVVLIVGTETNAAVSPASADLIIRNARITTQNPAQPSATAVAVKDGLILQVGDGAWINQFKGEQTEVIDANERRLIPGLNDSHLHITRGGRFFNLELRWEDNWSLADALAKLNEQASRTPKGQWVRVIGGWSPYQFKERRMPTLDEINAASPETPVFVLFLYSSGMLNRAALKELGITKGTAPPVGGRYEIGPDGEPTGMLLAEPNPTILYQTISKLPSLSEEDQVNSTRHFYRELNRLGLTSAIDAGGGGHSYPVNYVATDSLAKAGEIPIRISYYLFPQNKGNELEEFQNWLTITMPGHNKNSKLDHGYETRGGGEFLTWSAGDYENFLAPRPVQSKTMEKDLEAVVRLLITNRWPFRIHATYDESISRILNVLETVNQNLPFDGLRWAIDHAETISSSNISRIKALGGGIAVQSRMAFAGEYFLDRYGEDTTASAPPIREIFDSGVPMGAGSDATRVSSYNPWVALYWLVSGRTVGGTVLYGKENRLTRAEALIIYTLGSAWFSGEEGVKGRIAPGQYADFALLSEDFFTVPERKIKGIESVLTIVNGEIVYGAKEYSELSPALPAVSPAWSPVAWIKR